MKIFITGSNGLLGKELIHQIKNSEESYELIVSNRQSLDITNQGEVFRLISEIEPDVIINCAAMTDVDLCENNEDLAFKVNAIGPQNLAAVAYQLGAKIVQISTDYVFDGEGACPLREYDATNPLNVYGASKVLGEKLTRQLNPKHFLIRTAWLYGDGKNFIRTILELAAKNPVLNVVSDQIGSPTNSEDLARVILRLIATDSYGTYHATSEGSCSWHTFAERILSLKNIDKKVNKITSEQLNRLAKRPKYTVLENFMLRQIGLNCFPNWETAIEKYLLNKGL